MASAKKTTKKTAKKVEKAVETNTVKATAILRKGALAYVGLYGAAYERAKLRTEQVRNFSNKFFGEMVEKGEEIEVQATKLAKDAQKTATETFEETSEKVKSFVPSNILPFSKKDRVEELESEVAALNKKIATLSKKTTTPAKKPVKVTTEKTVEVTKTETKKVA